MLAALTFSTAALINLLIWVIAIAIVVVVLKAILEAMGIPIPRVVWIGIGGIIALLILMWFAQMVT